MALQNDFGGEDGYQEKSFAPPYTPQLNGIAERINRTMVEAALSLLIQANLPSCLWPFALKYAISIRNRIPHSTVRATPYSIVTGDRPSLGMVRVFGCTAYMIRLPRGSKFESRALDGVYLETLTMGCTDCLLLARMEFLALWNLGM